MSLVQVSPIAEEVYENVRSELQISPKLSSNVLIKLGLKALKDYHKSGKNVSRICSYIFSQGVARHTAYVLHFHLQNTFICSIIQIQSKLI